VRRGVVPRENLWLPGSHAGVVSHAGSYELLLQKLLKSTGFRRQIV
jgi:hypothetical protein